MKKCTKRLSKCFLFLWGSRGRLQPLCCMKHNGAIAQTRRPKAFNIPTGRKTPPVWMVPFHQGVLLELAFAAWSSNTTAFCTVFCHSSAGGTTWPSSESKVYCILLQGQGGSPSARCGCLQMEFGWDSGVIAEPRDAHFQKVRMLVLHFFQKVRSCGKPNHSGISAYAV